MNLEKLTIEGYKSIGKLEIVKPNPFTVFVGPNASGKSNIFESLDLFALCIVMNSLEAIKKFGNIEDINNKLQQSNRKRISFKIDFGKDIGHTLEIHSKYIQDILTLEKIEFDSLEKDLPTFLNYGQNPDYLQLSNFTRLFVGKSLLDRRNNQDDSRLNTNASNLEKVLKRILKDENKREEIFEILQLLIPGFERVEIITEEFSGSDNLLIKEESLKKPIPKRLISDGTYNILAIIAALYQSDEPQFLCIEEPENGINPFVVKELVDIIRDICEEKGHYVWLNTHSQSLVSVLTKEEIIIVDKKNGLTEIKQIPDMDLHGLRMDDALYTNSIGGGNPW